MPESWTEVVDMRGQMFARERNDCTVIALAKVTGIDYQSAHDLLRDAGRKDGQGIPIGILISYLRKECLYDFIAVNPKPAYLRTLRETAHKFEGRYLVSVKAGYMEGHAFAMLDGRISDTIVNHLPILGLWKLKEKE